MHTTRVPSVSGKSNISLLTLGIAVSALILFPAASHAQSGSVDQLTAPEIRSIQPQQEGGNASLRVSGNANALAAIDIELIAQERGSVYKNSTKANAAGEWSLTIADNAFPHGGYTLRVSARDVLGNVSPVTVLRGHKVAPESTAVARPGTIDLLILGALLLTAIAGFAGWYHDHRKIKTMQNGFANGFTDVAGTR